MLTIWKICIKCIACFDLHIDSVFNSTTSIPDELYQRPLSSIVQHQYRISCINSVDNLEGFSSGIRNVLLKSERKNVHACIDSVDNLEGFSSGIRNVLLKSERKICMHVSTVSTIWKAFHLAFEMFYSNQREKSACMYRQCQQSLRLFIWYSKCSTQIREKNVHACIDSVDNPEGFSNVLLKSEKNLHACIDSVDNLEGFSNVLLKSEKNLHACCRFILKTIQWHIHAGSWSLVNCLAGSLYEAFYKVLMNIN